jgi:hypothetical protein
VIFHALSFDRQRHILDNWDIYLIRFINVREEVEEQVVTELLDWLKAIDTLLDEALIREREKWAMKAENRKKVRDELQSTVAYGQMQQLKRIKEISQIPV